MKKGQIRNYLFNNNYPCRPANIIIGTIALITLSITLLANANGPEITYEKMLAKSTMQPPFRIYHQLKDECYRQNARDKKHCIRTGLAIAYAESSWKDNHTPFGLQSYEKGYDKWVRSYNKYWYKSSGGFFFYGDWGKYGPSHYCTSEESSGSSYGCPNGRINFNHAYNSLKL